MGYRCRVVIVGLGLVLAGCGPAELPDVVGEELSFTRGALASADIEYEAVEVDVDDPDEDGIVQDGNGNTIGTTNTVPAELIELDPSLSALYCNTTFELDVDIADFYEVQVGRRGSLSYSYDELRSADFHVSLTLG